MRLLIAFSLIAIQSSGVYASDLMGIKNAYESLSMIKEQGTFDGMEKMCLALTIYHESRSEPIEGQLAVANVVRNRVKSNKWPNSYCEVVFQPHQFEWVFDKTSNRIYEKSAFAVSLKIADLVYKKTIGDITYGATNYHATYITPPTWSRKLHEIETINNHIFYR